MATTTIRVNTATRDRLNAYLDENATGETVDTAINQLLDLHWQIICIAQADRRREEQAGTALDDLQFTDRLTALLLLGDDR